MNIYVGNLAFDTTEDGVRNLFSSFGNITSVRLISDRDTGRPKGFGFVEMSNSSEAEAAINALNGKMLDGREIKVNEAKPREERPGGGNRGGNRGGGGGGYNRW
jgi:cold-inducible RNA-binding protein